MVQPQCGAAFSLMVDTIVGPSKFFQKIGFKGIHGALPGTIMLRMGILGKNLFEGKIG
jgi:hypothetical protein